MYIYNVVTYRVSCYTENRFDGSELKCFYVSCIHVSSFNSKLLHRESVLMCLKSNVSMYLVSMYLLSIASCHTENPF